jgi:hypothetical protein
MLTIIVTTCAYAEFYGCLQIIGHGVLCSMKSSPEYWKTVAENPKQFLMLAAKLEDAETYQDALRHLVVQSYLEGHWTDVVEVTGWFETDLDHHYTPQFKDLRSKVQSLREDLQKLQLVYMRVKRFGGGYYKAFTRFLDVKRLQGAETPDRVHFLGGAIWSECLTNQISGEEITASFTCFRGGKSAG